MGQAHDDDDVVPVAPGPSEGSSPSPPAGEHQKPLPAFFANGHGSSTEPGDLGPEPYPDPLLEERSDSIAFKVQTTDPEGQTRMWAKPEYWDREHYQGIWEDLELPRYQMRRSTRLLSVVGLVALFLVPLLVDSVWWLTMLISEALVGALVIVGSPGRRRLAALLVGIGAVVGMLGLEVYNDLAFKTLSLVGPPPTVLVCGGSYTRQTTSPVPLPDGIAVHAVGRTPSGSSLLGNARCNSQNADWVFVDAGHRLVIPYLVAGYQGPTPPYSQ